MKSSEISQLSHRSLLKLYRDIGQEFKSRRVCRTSNNPVGDIGEYLFRECYGWKLMSNSHAGYDAEDSLLGRIQIKTRFLRDAKSSRQAGDMRNLEKKKFDWFAGVVFSPECGVDLAFLAPYDAISNRSLTIPSLQTSRIYLKHDWLNVPRVRDATSLMSSKWDAINAADQQSTLRN